MNRCRCGLQNKNVLITRDFTIYPTSQFLNSPMSLDQFSSSTQHRLFAAVLVLYLRITAREKDQKILKSWEFFPSQSNSSAGRNPNHMHFVWSKCSLKKNNNNRIGWSNVSFFVMKHTTLQHSQDGLYRQKEGVDEQIQDKLCQLFKIEDLKHRKQCILKPI